MKTMNRREALRTLAAGAALGAVSGALVVVASPPATCQRIVGLTDAPYKSEKFDGAGYYAFAADGVFGKRVKHARVDDHWGIGLSDGPDAEIDVYVSHRRFDAVCWGKCMTVAENESKRRAA